LACDRLFKTALLAAALSGVVLLEGCGRRGMPVPLDSAAEQKADQSSSSSPSAANSTANSQKKLPHGIDDNSLKAGAQKTPTPFDFLL
jgi:hypothetical protein